MGKSSISYKKNNINFKEAKRFYYKEATEASNLDLFNKTKRFDFKEVEDIEEFDNGEYIFKFKNEEFFVVEGETKHWSC